MRVKPKVVSLPPAGGRKERYKTSQNSPEHGQSPKASEGSLLQHRSEVVEPRKGRKSLVVPPHRKEAQSVPIESRRDG